MAAFAFRYFAKVGIPGCGYGKVVEDIAHVQEVAGLKHFVEKVPRRGRNFTGFFFTREA